MSEIRIEDFKGRVPRRSDRLLPPTYGTVARNVDLYSGELRGMRAPTHWKTFPTGTQPKRVWRVKKDDSREFSWFTSPNYSTELLKSPLVNDAYDRWYVFTPGQPPKVLRYVDIKRGREPGNLAVIGPVNGPEVDLVDDIDNDKDIETRTYVITYVTQWGEESAPSPATNIEVNVGGRVRLHNLYNAVLPELERRAYKYVRIYRSSIGNVTSSLRFVRDVWYGKPELFDHGDNGKISTNSEMSSFNDPPPHGLWGARAHPSGALVAFKGRDIYFSRPFLPHAWPEDWKLTLKDEIVGLEVMGDSVIVLTTGSPAIVYGSDPANVSLQTSSYKQPVLSYESITAAPEGVYFATDHGIMVATTNGAQSLTEPLMTRKEWQAEFYSPQLILAVDGDRLFAYSPDGRGFVLTRGQSGLELTTLEGLAEAGGVYSDPYTNEIGVISGDTLYHWDSHEGEETDYKWRSKEFVLAKPDNFETVQVELTQRREVYEPEGFMSRFETAKPSMDRRNEVLFRAWCDGEFVCELVVQDAEPATMPRGFKGTSWIFEIEGQCRLHSVTISPSGKGQARG